MKTLVLKTLIFGILSILILNVVLDPRFKDLNLNSKTFTDFNEDKRPLDILIIGSSHAKNTFNPEMIDAVFNTNTYNLSSGGQLLLVSNYLLDDVLKTKKPKLVIVDLYPSVMNLPGLTKSKGFQLRVFDNTQFSLPKVNSINKIYDFKELSSVFSETIRNHDKWYNRNWTLEEFELNKNMMYSKGFLNSDKTMGSKDRLKHKDFLNQYKQFLKIVPSPQELLEFEKNNKDLIHTISYCKENDIKVLFVSAPYFPSFYQKKLNKFHYLLNKHLENNDMQYVDFNKNFNSLGLGLNDFSNQGHLNIEGSKKVSTALIEKIAEKGFFKVIDSSHYVNLLKQIKPREDIKLNEKIKLKQKSLIKQSKSQGVTYDLSHTFINKIKIDKVTFSINTENRYVILESKAVLNDDSIIDDYYFFLSGTIFKEDFDKRPKWNLGTDKDKLLWEAFPERALIGNKNYYILKLDRKCSIDQFKEIKIVLRNKVTKKGAGHHIILDSIKLKK